MQNIVYDIIGGVLILGIILAVINVFRGSAGVVKDAAEKQFEEDFVDVEQTVGFDNKWYSGATIVNALNLALVSPERYAVYIIDGSTSFRKAEVSGNILYLGGTGYNWESKKNGYINSNIPYLLNIRYHSDKNAAMSYYTPVASGDRKKGDLDIAQIRFYFSR